MADSEGADVKLVQSSPSFEVWRGPKGVLRLDWTKKGVVRLIVKGHGHAEFGAPAVRRFDDAVRMARLTAVADFWDMDSYESEFRMRMQTWGSQHRKDMDALVVATKSKLVSMGASVAQLAMGVPMKAFTRRDDIDRECQKLGLPVNPSLLG